jgi:hypothetical protein
LGCGKINAVSNQDVYNFTVSRIGKKYIFCGFKDPKGLRISDITDKIIPFYSTYRVEGVKALDFVRRKDFDPFGVRFLGAKHLKKCKAAELIKNKAIRGRKG